MSYYMYDSLGYVGDVASNKGMDDLVKYLTKHPDVDDLEKLVKEGTILKTDHLVEEINLLGIPKDQDIKDTLDNLKVLINKAKDVIIITQEPGE